MNKPYFCIEKKSTTDGTLTVYIGVRCGHFRPVSIAKALKFNDKMSAGNFKKVMSYSFMFETYEVTEHIDVQEVSNG
jgi:hypothetical protein